MKQLFAILMILTACLLAGCVRSEVLIASSPAGADIKVENKEYGKTPEVVPFTWYWHHKIELTKEGYEPVSEFERFYAPPWLWFPFDLVCELMPFTITDRKYVHYTLKPISEE